MRRRSVSTVLLGMAILAVAVSCGGADKVASEPASEGNTVSAPPTRAQVDPALVGTEWLLVSLDGDELLSETDITLEIDEEIVSGSAGCNAYGGPVDKMTGGSIEWAGARDMSEMGCPEDVRRQETRYVNLLDGIEAYRIERDQLRLIDGGGETKLLFEEKTRLDFDPAALAGTRWVLRSVDGEEPVEGSVPTLEFGQGREATWYDGCVEGSGRYTVSGYELVFKQEGTVEGECMKPERLANPEEPCVQVCFYPSGNYRLRDGLLEIRSDTEVTTAILEPLAKGARLERDGLPWELRSFVEDGKATRVRGDDAITLTFDRGTLRDEGTISGTTGCNDYRATYEFPRAHNTFERIMVADPVATRRKCDGPPYLSEQEQRFLVVLGDLGEYPIVSRGGEMTLETRDGRRLIFVAPE